MTKENLTKMIIGLSIVILGIVYWVIYQPLQVKIKRGAQEVAQIEAQVLAARASVGSVDGHSIRKPYTSEEDIAKAINELTAIGKSKDIRFISIAPQPAQSEKDYKILLINLSLESRYEGLALFCGSLEQLKKSLCVIKSFDITPDQKNVFDLQTHMVIKMYLLGLNDGQ